MGWPAAGRFWPACAALLGFAEGAFSPGGLKVVSEWFPAKERGLAGGLYNIGPSLGSMLAPPLVAWAILNYSWQASFVIVGADQPGAGWRCG